MERPRQIWWSFYISAASLLAGVLMFCMWLFRQDYPSNVVTPLLAAQTFNVFLFAFLYYKIFKSKRWARTTLVVIYLIGIALHNAMPSHGETNSAVFWGQAAVQAAAILLLFVRKSKEWFERVAGVNRV